MQVSVAASSPTTRAEILKFPENPEITAGYSDDEYYEKMKKIAKAAGLDRLESSRINSEEEQDTFEWQKPSKSNIKSEEKQTKSDMKNPLEIAISISGAIIAPIITGKALAMTTQKMFPNVSKAVLKNAPILTQKIGNKIDDIVASGKTANLIKRGLEYSKDGVSALFNKVIKGETPSKTLENIAAAIAVITTTPQLLTADGNGDGVKDITQKCVSAYDSLLGSMHGLRTLLDISV